MDAVLAWLLRWPSAWDLFATVAATGSWLVAWRQLRASRNSTRPIFAVRVWPRGEDAYRVELTVTNREDHTLRVILIEGLGGMACATLRYTYDAATSRSDEVASEFAPVIATNQLFKAAGHRPSTVGHTTFGHGDTGSFAFAARPRVGARSMAFRLTVEQGNADLRPLMKKIVVRTLPPKTTA